jgi:hypothetical protein
VTPSTRVYVIALTDDVNSVAEALPAVPLRRAAGTTPQRQAGTAPRPRTPDSCRAATATRRLLAAGRGRALHRPLQPTTRHARERVLPHTPRRSQKTAPRRLVAEDAEDPERRLGALRADARLRRSRGRDAADLRARHFVVESRGAARLGPRDAVREPQGRGRPHQGPRHRERDWADAGRDRRLEGAQTAQPLG